MAISAKRLTQRLLAPHRNEVPGVGYRPSRLFINLWSLELMRDLHRRGSEVYGIKQGNGLFVLIHSEVEIPPLSCSYIGVAQ